MSTIFVNEEIFQHNIFKFDMRGVDIVEAFANASLPEDEINMCLPFMSSEQQTEFLDLNLIENDRQWVLKNVLQRSCDCLTINPCGSQGTCFDNMHSTEGNTPTYTCVCKIDYTGPDCSIQKPTSLPQYLLKLTFENIEIVNKTKALKDFTFLFAELFNVHPDDIIVTIEDTVVANRRREVIAGSTKVTATIATTVSPEYFKAAAFELELSDTPLANKTSSLEILDIRSPEENTSSPFPIALVVGCSVGGIILILGLIYYFKKVKKNTGYLFV